MTIIWTGRTIMMTVAIMTIIVRIWTIMEMVVVTTTIMPATITIMTTSGGRGNSGGPEFRGGPGNSGVRAQSSIGVFVCGSGNIGLFEFV